MEAYINYILVKSRSREDHLDHLRDVFQLMRAHHLLLNLKKCTFGIGFRNFRRFLVSQMGIKMALGQVQAIEKMQPPITKKQILAII